MGLFSRKKKTETEKAKARGKTKSKRQVARARVQRGAGKGTRNVVYFLDQAPLYKLLGLGLALYGINKVAYHLKSSKQSTVSVHDNETKSIVIGQKCSQGFRVEFIIT